MKESSITKHLKKKCREHGILYKKISDRFRSGFPDTILINDGAVWFVELKAGGKRPTPLQYAVGEEILAAGGNWSWFDSTWSIDAFLERLCR